MSDAKPEILKGLQEHVAMKTGKPAPGSDPANPVAAGNEDYYKSSATLFHYKKILNEKLKAKNPEAYNKYFEGLKPLRQAMNQGDVNKYIESTPYNDYLSPEEIKKTLGAADYEKYLNSIKSVNQFNIEQGKQPLFGQVEGENDINKLNYGRRFASLAVTTSYAKSVPNTGKKYSRSYSYNPTSGNVDFTDEGDITLRPETFASTK